MPKELWCVTGVTTIVNRSPLTWSRSIKSLELRFRAVTNRERGSTALLSKSLEDFVSKTPLPTVSMGRWDSNPHCTDFKSLILGSPLFLVVQKVLQMAQNLTNYVPRYSSPFVAGWY